MPPRKVAALIKDMREAVLRIEKATGNLSYEDFIADETVLQAVLYNFAVIGEAASKVPTRVKDEHTDIPWAQIVGMRNVVIHEYFRIDAEILFKTLREDLPRLLVRLTEIKV